MTVNGKKRISITINKKLLEDVDRLRKTELGNLNRSQLIEKAVETFVENKKRRKQ